MGVEQRSNSLILHCRNSISAKLSLSTKPKPTPFSRRPHGVVPPLSLDLELISLKSSPPPPLASYTSLRDVLPYASAVDSPTTVTSSVSAGDLPIRNRLVKQAASAYLSAAATLSPCTGPSFLPRLWLRLSAIASSTTALLNRVLCSLCIPLAARC